MADYAFLDASLLSYLSDVPVIVMDNFGAGAYANKGRSNDGHDVQQVPRQANVLSIFDATGNSQPFALSHEPIEAAGDITLITITNPAGPTSYYRLRLAS